MNWIYIDSFENNCLGFHRFQISLSWNALSKFDCIIAIMLLHSVAELTIMLLSNAAILDIGLLLDLAVLTIMLVPGYISCNAVSNFQWTDHFSGTYDKCINFR